MGWDGQMGGLCEGNIRILHFGVITVSSIFVFVFVFN